jgi:WD40 repeat protein
MSSFHSRELTRFNTVTSMDFHPTELIIAVSVIKSISLTQRICFTKVLRLLPDGTIDETPIETLPENTHSPVAFSPSGQFLATGHLYKNNSEVILWQCLPKSPSGHPVSSFTGHTEFINSIDFDPTGRFLATGSYDKTARVWQVRTDGTPATCLATLTDHSSVVTSVAFSPTGRFLATGSWDKTVKLWCKAPDDDRNWTRIAILDQSEVGGVYSSVNSIAFHPTLPLLAIGLGHGTVTLWQKQPADDTKWTLVKTMKEDDHREVHSVAFHPDGLFLAIGSHNRTVKIWMLTNDKNVAKCVDTLFCGYMVNQIRFHRCGKFMAVVTYEGTLILYDTSVLIQKKTELLATQGTARLLAHRLSTDPTSTDRGLHNRREQKITREVDAANPPLQVALLNSREADAKAKANIGKGGRISQRKRKINKRHSYRR